MRSNRLFEPWWSEDHRKSIRRGKLRIDSCLIVRHGHLVLDERFQIQIPSLLPEGRRRDVMGVTHSVVSALTGIAIAEGHIAGVDASLVGFFPERTIADLERKRAIALEHLLTMSTGMEAASGGLS